MGRKTAGRRILYVIPLIVFNYVLAFVGLFILVPYAILDILVHLARGEGLPYTAALVNFYRWHVDNTVFVLFGQGDWAWTP